MIKWFRRLIELIKDWEYLVRRDGWKAAKCQVGREIATLPYRHIQYIVMARSLLLPLSEVEPKITLEIRPFKATDLDFTRRENRPSEANLCARRLERGHYGWAAFKDNQVVAYNWACTDLSLERVDLRFEPGDVLLTDGFTASAARCKGMQTALSSAMLRTFRNMGYKRAIAYIDIHNKPSLAVWSKIGAHMVARIDFQRFGFWRRTRYS